MHVCVCVYVYVCVCVHACVCEGGGGKLKESLVSTSSTSGMHQFIMTSHDKLFMMPFLESPLKAHGHTA